MNLQIQCPFCRIVIAVEQQFMGHTVQCPGCRQLLVVGAAPVPAPVVQPIVATPPPARPGVPRGAAPKVGLPKAPSQAPKAEPKKGRAMAIVLVLAILGAIGGLVYGGMHWVSVLQAKAKEDPFGVPESVKKRDREAREKLQQEQHAEAAEAAEHREFARTQIRDVLCEGNDKAATEMIAMFEEIQVAYEKLTADADPDNDPKDLPAYWISEFTKRAKENPVLFHWLGGRSATSLAQVLFGTGKTEAPRGQTPDFLVGTNYRSSGTGFFVSADGWLVTNAHVVQDAQQVDARSEGGQILEVKVVKVDSKADLALLKMDTQNAAWLPLSGADVQMGQSVFTVGFPNLSIQGVEPKFTDGRISSLSGVRDDQDSVQISVPIQPGNSGGALVDLKSGEVVGVVFSRLSSRVAQNANYAIKANVLHRFLSGVPGLSLPGAASAATDEATLFKRATAASVLLLVE
jgi:serine protease Do